MTTEPGLWRFNEWRALGYLRAWPIRHLTIHLSLGLDTFVRQPDSTAVKENEELGRWISQYAENTEKWLLRELPF